jgi:hypothetical protein
MNKLDQGGHNSTAGFNVCTSIAMVIGTTQRKEFEAHAQPTGDAHFLRGRDTNSILMHARRRLQEPY